MEIVNEIIMKPIGEIKPYEKNPRRNSKTVELLTKVIPVVGFNVPLVIDKDGVIVKGHARYMAAQALGMTEVPCVISEADPESIKADRIADNKVSEFSKWLDGELLHEVDMINTGLDFAEFGLPVMEWVDETDSEMFQDDEEEDDLEEKKKRFLEMLQEEQKQPVITTQQAIDSAKKAQAEEVKPQAVYHSVTCEKCGHVMFVREGDAMTWE